MLHCPYPGCFYTFDYLTKLHCESHGMTKEKLIKKYGEPKPVRVDENARKANAKLAVGLSRGFKVN